MSTFLILRASHNGKVIYGENVRQGKRSLLTQRHTGSCFGYSPGLLDLGDRQFRRFLQTDVISTTQLINFTHFNTPLVCGMEILA
jgi:hypothetical protein